MKVNQSGNSPVQNAETSGTRNTGKASGPHAAKNSKSKVDTAKSEKTSDAKVDVSQRGKESARAKKIATDTPDVRDERVAELKRRIESGNYKVDANAVADRMVDEHLRTSGIG